MAPLHDAIRSLETSTQAIDKFLDDPKNYNSIYAHYLESISWEMHKQTNELKELQYRYGI